MAEKKPHSKAILVFILIVGGMLWFVLTRPVEDDLVGEWQFAYTGDIMLFKADSTFEVHSAGSLYNHGDYRLDLSQSPGRITIIPKRVLWFAGYRAEPLSRGIIRFTDKNVVEMAFIWGPRQTIGYDLPDTFDDPSIVRVTLQRLP